MINKANIKEKEFYDKIGKTIGWDFSKIKCDIIDNSKFNFFNEVNNNITNSTILLDIGTGGGEGLSNAISKKCLLKIGTDFSKEMIKTAKKNNKNPNICFFEMDSNNIKFPDNFFDIVTARHTPFNENEIYRVLKKEGLFFSEQIDEEDCKELKEIFGRGQGFDVECNLRDTMELELKNKKFSRVEFFDIFQKEYYRTAEDLLFLLSNTPIIPYFGKDEGDYIKFNKYIEKNKTEKGILLNRKLFGIKARK